MLASPPPPVVCVARDGWSVVPAQASSINNVDGCVIRALGCDEAKGEHASRCVATAALRTLLSGRMHGSYVDSLGPLLDRFVGDRPRMEALLRSDPSGYGGYGGHDDHGGHGRGSKSGGGTSGSSGAGGASGASGSGR